MNTDVRYMERALQLALRGRATASPNPMVGAVIVHDSSIIGEGWHRKCGEGHAEVNAVASVADESLLKESTMYVTLEPCSHYGKTPPCAGMIIARGIPRVVVATLDPFEKVAGRGVQMLRDAGVEVEVGMLEESARKLNRRFFTAHINRRPYVTLKWAQSADGFMDAHRVNPSDAAFRFSTELTSLLTARLRSLHDGILTTADTVMADNPRLTVRGWCGPTPTPIIVDRSNRLGDDGSYHLSDDPRLIRLTGEMGVKDVLTDLYDRGVTSILVEAGPRFLKAIIDEGLWDAARVEISPVKLGTRGVHHAPQLPCVPVGVETWGSNKMLYYRAPGGA